MKIKYSEPAKKSNVLANMACGAVVRFPQDGDPISPWMVVRSNSAPPQIVRLSDGKSVQNPHQNAEVEELVCTLTVEGVK